MELYAAPATIGAAASVAITNSGDDAIRSFESDLTIEGNASLAITNCPDDGIDTSDGDVYIRGGSVNSISGDHAVYAQDGSVMISGGNIVLDAGDEGLEVDKDIVISGGSVTVNAQDRGIDSDENITISGGTLNIDAGGISGIEAASGTVTILGGTVSSTAYGSGILADVINIIDGSVALTTLTEGYGAAAACTSLSIPSNANYQVAYKYLSGYGQDMWTIVNAEGNPVAICHLNHTPGSAPAPQTGDSTPIALLAVLMIASLCGMIVSRKRMA